jgi:hypothetical protein
MFNHERVTKTRPTIRWESGRLLKLYVVETELPLDPEDRHYDKDAVDELMAKLEAYVKAKPEAYDGYEIVQFDPM